MQAKIFAIQKHFADDRINTKPTALTFVIKQTKPPQISKKINIK